MTTLFNYWHYIIIGIILIFSVTSVFFTFKQKNKKLVSPMLISIALISILIAGFSVIVVDKYTKKVKIYKLDSKRLLSIEKIIYTGIVKNEGNHAIGTVKVEIKLVNKGSATGNVKGGNFYKPSGFLDFFKGGADILYKPQTIVKEFVVAKKLKPGEAKAFRVNFSWPPYFRSVAQFVSVTGH
ncbi:MAG: hypothetical protein ACJAWW_000135 [Sulfurimonas sp.]|jgi:hypothetical protein